MYRFSADVSEEAYRAFLATRAHYNVMQRPEWVKVKSDWGHYYCLLLDGDRPVGGGVLLSRKFAPGVSVLYAPRGVLIDYSSPEQVRAFAEGVKAFAKKQGAYAVRIDPEIVLSRTFCEETVEDPEGKAQLERLVAAGFRHMGYDKGFHKYTQPRYNAEYSLLREDGEGKSDQELVKSYKKQVSKFIGSYTQKRGFTFEHATGAEAVERFSELVRFTEQRQHILLRNQSYFERVKDAFGDDNVFFFATMDLDRFLEYVESELQKESADRERLTEDKVRALELKEQYGSKVTTAAMDTVRSSDTAYFLYAGFNDTVFSRFNSTMQIRYEAMRYYRDQGVKKVDFMGVHGDLNDSLAMFKLKFNPTVVEYAGEFELPVRPVRYQLVTRFLPPLKRAYIKLKLRRNKR